MEAQKVYAVLYNAYEFDDLGYGDLTPIFLSLNKDNCKNKLNEYKIIKTDSYESFIKTHADWLEKNPNEKENYQIVINTDNEFKIWLGNWCYHYKLKEYELDKVITRF